MNANVKWFDTKKGYGFLVTDDGTEIFVHQNSIIMDGFRYLNENDIVTFELGAGKNGRKQAVNVKPVLTRKMISKALKEEKLHVKTVANPHATCRLYMVVNDKDEPLSSEQGMSFMELAAFAGFDIEGLAA